VGEGDFTLPIADISVTVPLCCRQIDWIILWSVDEGPFMIQYLTETLWLGCQIVIQHLKPRETMTTKKLIVGTPRLG